MPHGQGLRAATAPPLSFAPAAAYPAHMDEIRALQALAVILAEDELRDRFLALTGHDSASLRARLTHPDMAAAVEAFLAGHEPDLIRVAAALGLPPEALAGRP